MVFHTIVVPELGHAVKVGRDAFAAKDFVVLCEPDATFDTSRMDQEVDLRQRGRCACSRDIKMGSA